MSALAATGFGIALIPDKASRDAILKLHNTLHAIHPLGFKLGKESEPHLTLLQLYGPNLSQALTAVRLLSETLKTIELEISGISFLRPTWWFLDVKLSSTLRDIHDKVFHMLAPDLSGPNEIDETKLSHFTPLHRENFLKFGYRFIGEAYNPHVTLGKSLASDGMEHKILEILTAELHNISSTLIFDQLSLFSLGPNGTTENVHFKT